MTDRERQDVFVFVAFIVVGGLVALSIVVATHTWKQDSWVAIGALGACAQAIAVIGGLVYAGRQLHELRVDRLAEAERVRTDRAIAALTQLADHVNGELTDILRRIGDVVDGYLHAETTCQEWFKWNPSATDISDDALESRDVAIRALGREIDALELACRPSFFTLAAMVGAAVSVEEIALAPHGMLDLVSELRGAAFGSEPPTRRPISSRDFFRDQPSVWERRQRLNGVLTKLFDRQHDLVDEIHSQAVALVGNRPSA